MSNGTCFSLLQLCRAPYKPKLTSEGDCSNFDVYPEETEEERLTAQTTTIGKYSIQDVTKLFPDF